ncbi:MAG: efflux RND transporter periplasmic adaptor subunit [Defluviitaleaceae bacterium]|nr:efflux RND transporter periplasmic adaptor subunit [Defluviitaleaceae bacterium]
MKFLRIIVLAALLGLSACADGQSTLATTQERIIPVNTAPVSTSTIYSQLSYAGQVHAAEHIAVMSRVPGMVDQVMVDVGDFVSEGDILFTMDPVDLQNNINSLTAQLATAEAAVNSARTGVTQAGGSAVQQQILQATGGVAQAETAMAQAETQVEQASLGLSQAQNAHDTARQSYMDTSALFVAGVATRMQMDQSEMALSNAQIALEQAQNNYNIANVGLSQAQTSHRQAVQSHQLVVGEMPEENRQRAQDALAQATAQRNSLQVNLNAAREQLNNASIRSPISGVIGSRNIEPQTMLGQGTPPFTVVSADTVTVNVEVTEAIINRIYAGQKVSVRIGAASAELFVGEVTLVSPAANQMTSTFTIEVSVDNHAGTIRPGMFAEVFFTRDRAENAVVVPRSAVLIENGEPVVYVADGDRAIRRPVVIGIDTGAEIEIISGLSLGEPLIIRGQTSVTDGVAILIVESGGDI